FCAFCAFLWLDENFEAAGAFEGLGAAVNVELLIDVAHVALYRARGEEEFVGDLLVREPTRDVLQNLQLTLAQRIFNIPPRQCFTFSRSHSRRWDRRTWSKRILQLNNVTKQLRLFSFPTLALLFQQLEQQFRHRLAFVNKCAHEILGLAQHERLFEYLRRLLRDCLQDQNLDHSSLSPAFFRRRQQTTQQRQRLFRLSVGEQPACKNQVLVLLHIIRLVFMTEPARFSPAVHYQHVAATPHHQ